MKTKNYRKGVAFVNELIKNSLALMKPVNQKTFKIIFLQFDKKIGSLF